jgi:D-threo-aldose 1-dehydrogenase
VTGRSTVPLRGTAITTSVLGFGCSRLLGPMSRAEALRLLETAYDAGIRHFDVARAYGSGDAEDVLGEYIARRRDDVTVTTKFGIQPLPAVAERRLLLGAARRVMRASPAVRRFLGRQGARLVKRAAFSAEDARTSLETSLRKLRTDYVDLLLLHDCALENCSPELLDFLITAVAAGKVRCFGVGTSVESAASIARSAPEFGDVLQFEHSVLRPSAAEVDPTGERALITHGALVGVRRLGRYLAENPDVATEWSEELGVDCGDDRVLAALMLHYAVATNGRGPVLFSTTRAENVVRNATALAEQPSPTTLERFATLVGTAPLDTRAGAPSVAGRPRSGSAHGAP